MNSTDLPMELPDTVTLRVEDIKPYWNNPRTISEEAVAALEDSMTRYGYLQPIVVDSDHVVVVGHTRLQALKKMGVEEVPVYVATDLSDEQVKEFRLVDNRTSEMTTWDHDALVQELREMETSLIEMYFPDVDYEVEMINSTIPDESDVREAAEQVATVNEAKVVETTGVTCPSCFHSFRVRTDSLP